MILAVCSLCKISVEVLVIKWYYFYCKQAADKKYRS